MKVSAKFLSDYIDLSDGSVSEIATKMVMIGNEMESLKKISSATNVVVGKVLECENHPNSEKLHVCKVDVGSEVLQIVCGAQNVKKGIKVIVALNGATLPGDITIRECVLRGVSSNGMICALEELGIETKYIPEDEGDGIHILSDDAAIGSDALKYLEYDDYVMDFDLTANRSDLLSIIGMAYEVGAITDKKVNTINTNIKETSNIDKMINLEVRTPNCSSYYARIAKDVVVKKSPNFISSRLMACGIRPINNVVDISNYVMLEYGNPLHFFDYDVIGNDLVVRMAKQNEKIVTIDSTERTLCEDDIVIDSKNSAVCLAGVMGGLNSEVTSKTKNILIEAAIFNPVNIRNTSKRHLRSEASIRFEKGIDPNITEKAINRACYLLEKYADATIIFGNVHHDITEKEDKLIEISLDKIISVLGLEISLNEVENVFKRLDFKYEIKGNNFIVHVPSRRLDISIKEDLIEEVGRIHGISNVKGILPSSSIKSGSYDKTYLKIKNAKKRLESLGLNEVITYSLVGKSNKTLFTNDIYDEIKLISYISEDRMYLRYSLIPSLIEVAHYNMNRGLKDILIYESGKRYKKNGDKYVEENLISGLLVGSYLQNSFQGPKQNIDFYLVKGLLENLLNYLGLANRYEFSSENVPGEFHPGISSSIMINKEIIGYFGMVNPLYNKNNLFVFELNMDKLLETKVREIKHKEISKYPSIVKDMAFIVSYETTSKEIEEIIKKKGTKTLVSTEVFDVYVGPNVGDNKKSIAYKLTFSDANKTLTEEEVLNIFNDIIKEVTNKLNAVLRDK